MGGLAAARARGRTGGQKPKLGPRQVKLARQMYDEIGADGKRRYTVAQIAGRVRGQPTDDLSPSRPPPGRRDAIDGFPRWTREAPLAGGAVSGSVALRRGSNASAVASGEGGLDARARAGAGGPTHAARARRDAAPAGGAGGRRGAGMLAAVVTALAGRGLGSGTGAIAGDRPDAVSRVRALAWERRGGAPRADRAGRVLPSLRTLQRAFVRELWPAERAAVRTGEPGIRAHGLYVDWEPDHRNEVWQGDHKQLDVLVLAPRARKYANCGAAEHRSPAVSHPLCRSRTKAASRSARSPRPNFAQGDPRPRRSTQRRRRRRKATAGGARPALAPVRRGSVCSSLGS